MVKRGNFLDSFTFKHKAAQITIFVILALIIVAAIAGYFLINSNIFPKQVPANMQEFYNYYLSCIDTNTKEGAKLMELGAGYLDKPNFQAGSDYAPFSNQLAFLGTGIPYWYYISNNGIAKEQIPLKSEMEKQLANYISQEPANKCDFSYFENKGYNISLGKSSAKVTINSDTISVSLNQKLNIRYGGENFVISSHKVETDSKLGKFYDSAKKIYNYEFSQMFLENYVSDVLYTYAPVEGFSLNCSPTIWDPNDVFNKLKLALEANIGSVKLNSGYYVSKNKNGNYFISGKGVDFGLDKEQINFLYSKDWPSRFEVWQTQGGMMVAQPVGTQEGLNMMGFCYTPYKFVYDISVPVMVQLTSEDGSEMFEFPFAVVINKNVARQANVSYEDDAATENLCDNANTDIEVYTYNANLDPVKADIEFQCLNSQCYLGKTVLQNKSSNLTGDSKLTAKVPQCVNGILTASASGYQDKQYVISTNEESRADILLNRQSTLGLQVYVDGQLTKNLAILTISDKTAGTDNIISTTSYPSQNSIKLADGDYSFNLKVFNSGSLTIPSTTKRQCFTVLSDNILGYLGMTQEKCSDITLPSQTVSNVLFAGGEIEQYVSQSELETGSVLKIYASSVPTPSSVEQLQDGYEQIKSKSLDIQIS